MCFAKQTCKRKKNNNQDYNNMDKSANRRIIFLIVLLALSLIINVIILLPYTSTVLQKVEQKLFPIPCYTKGTPDMEVLDKVCQATIELKGEIMASNEWRGIPSDLRTFYGLHSIPNTVCSYPLAFGLVGASYYAASRNDSTSMNKLKKKAQEFIAADKGVLTYDIEYIDQIPIGILYLNLYKWFKDPVYLKIAKQVYNRVKEFREPNGIIMYRKGERQYCDVFGMYVPFLMEYFSVTKDSLAYKIADYNMEVYKSRGVDQETGIPFHGYNIHTGFPIGSANWGRGIGWYLLGAAFCPQFNDERLNKSLSLLEYTQFPGSSESFDSSTALMFEIYKQSKDKNRKLSLDFIKPHVLVNGFVDDCSGGTYDLNSYSHTFGESELCNGLLLMLASKFRN